MKAILLLPLFILYSVIVRADINYINISKITDNKELIEAFNFIQENARFYDHWEANWTFEEPKEDFINHLEGYFEEFSNLSSINEETYLLLGDIAHYLYNMEVEKYYQIAVTNYQNALELNPESFRGYWFLGYHYSLSNVPNSAIDSILKAEKLSSEDDPAQFWDDYAMVFTMTNMPSHAIYAMDKTKKLLGTEGNFELQLGDVVRNRLTPVLKNQSYSKQEIWTASQGENIAFISRPLGIKILADSTWNINIYDYQNNNTAFIITPPSIKNDEGREIGYTIAIIMKTVSENESIEEYINNLSASYHGKTPISFTNKYADQFGYEIQDSTMYQDIGGGHLYTIGIAREEPSYPGFLLETPALPPPGNNEIVYYRATESKDRFEGRIFYTIMLDSCEDIHEESLAIFKNFVEYQLIIE